METGGSYLFAWFIDLRKGSVNRNLLRGNDVYVGRRRVIEDITETVHTFNYRYSHDWQQWSILNLADDIVLLSNLTRTQLDYKCSDLSNWLSEIIGNNRRCCVHVVYASFGSDLICLTFITGQRIQQIRWLLFNRKSS